MGENILLEITLLIKLKIPPLTRKSSVNFFVLQVI